MLKLVTRTIASEIWLCFDHGFGQDHLALMIYIVHVQTYILYIVCVHVSVIATLSTCKHVF